MKQIKLNAFLLMGIFTMILASCSKENDGQVLSITESFESAEQEEEVEYPTAVTSYDEEVIETLPGEFVVTTNNDNLTATFDRLFANGENFNWSFPGASPASSTDANPGEIVFPAAGDYDVTLNVTIDDVDFSHTETVTFE